MGGNNPYIEEVKYTPATKKFKVTFLPSGKTIEVDPGQIPYGHNGIPGSILDIAEGVKAGLDHACGGVCACSTCHVVVRQGLESCNEATDAELDELDEAPEIALGLPNRPGRHDRHRRRDPRMEQELRQGSRSLRGGIQSSVFSV